MQTVLRRDGMAEVVRQDVPAAGPDQVVIEVSYAGVAAEEWGWCAPGSTLMGKILEVGSNVRAKEAGDWVVGVRTPDSGCGLGTVGVLEAHNCVPCTEITRDQAMLLPYLGSVLSCHLLLHSLKPSPGDTVFIPPSSEQPVMVQVAAALGLSVLSARSPYIPVPTPFNTTLLEADPEGSVAEMVAEVMFKTSGLGVDFVVATSDSADLVELAKAVTVRGTLAASTCVKQSMSLQATLAADKLLAAKACALRYHSLHSWLAAPTREGVVSHLTLEALRLITTGNVKAPSVAQVSLKSAVDALNAPQPKHLSVHVGNSLA